ESDPFTGDDTGAVATWKGESDLGSMRDEFVYLRFQMRSAKLFALRAE
ncbi:MAG: hypothetical protein IT364_03615, partial [Candidatus Hydrogenedentes bacterium]|nr:hypothetical protein [Candidatus Hydrogenedentota bacterium]